MLTTIKDILDRAREGRYGVPAPNVDNEHNARAVIEAAEELRSPIILGVLEGVNPDLRYFGRILTDLALRATVPVTFILDHGATFEVCVTAIAAGFPAIMADRSSLPYEENAAQVKELARIAHGAGGHIEAELGHVGFGENYAAEGGAALTDPAEAARFVAETGCDSLAVAVGTAHGVYKGTPKIHFDRLAELREKVPVPLVLHGGSGTGEENLKRACELGVCKVNLATDIKRASLDALLQSGTEGNAVHNLYPAIARGCKEKVQQYIRLFGSQNRA